MKRIRLPLYLLVVVTVVAACNKKKEITLPDRTLLLSPVELVRAGQTPRAPLRYSIPDGTVTRAVLDLRIATATTTNVRDAFGVLPGFRLQLRAGPTVSLETGTRYILRVTKAEAFVPEDTPQDEARQVERGITAMAELAGRLDLNDRGVVTNSTIPWNREQNEIKPRLLTTLNNVRSALVTVPFPKQAVGIGAQWTVRREINIWGNRVDQVSTYTLTRRDGNTVEVDIVIEQTGLPQVGNVNPNLEIHLLSYSMKATGRATVDLREPLAFAEAQSDARGEFALIGDGEPENVKTRQRAVLRLKPVD